MLFYFNYNCWSTARFSLLDNLSKEILTNWFEVFQKVVATIDLQNIYNMNETGFGIETNECSKVIINQNILKTCYKTNSRRQE